MQKVNKQDHPMTSLAQKTCFACESDSGVIPYSPEEAVILLKQVDSWMLAADSKSISKEIKTKDFAEALALANKVGAIAEEQGHHPDLVVVWGKLGITLWTHAIGGLSENDFIMAAKIDELLKSR
jgi:4a-hydroxytetrahydrobiopterin dehydratase